MLGVVPLVLVSDFLSMKFPNYFSVVLGLVLLCTVFLIPNGIHGLLQSWRGRRGSEGIARRLRRLADRIGGERQLATPRIDDSSRDGPRPSLAAPVEPNGKRTP